MKRSFIAFVFDADGYLRPYTEHPIFNGSIAPDCGVIPGTQNKTMPTFCDGLKVREFNGSGEAVAAMNDYMKGYHLSFEDRAAFKPEQPKPFVMLERIVYPKSK